MSLAPNPIEPMPERHTGLKYGQMKSRASRGRIRDLRWILDPLLHGGEVGPCTAIGQDYTIHVRWRDSQERQHGRRNVHQSCRVGVNPSTLHPRSGNN